MARKKPAFQIVYQPEIVRHLDAIEARHLSLIRTTIEEQLSYEPFTETTNRKPLLRESPFGENVWEIRFGPQNRLRVFYRADPDDAQRVLVEAIGIKNRNRLTIGGQEVKHED
jgi:hypothetical protein